LRLRLALFAFVGDRINPARSVDDIIARLSGEEGAEEPTTRRLGPTSRIRIWRKLGILAALPVVPAAKLELVINPLVVPLTGGQQ
jgi:hypothetical protein